MVKMFRKTLIEIQIFSLHWMHWMMKNIICFNVSEKSTYFNVSEKPKKLMFLIIRSEMKTKFHFLYLHFIHVLSFNFKYTLLLSYAKI